jgi:carboxyl-terminal processing protease
MLLTHIRPILTILCTAFNEGMANTFEGIGARLVVDNEAVSIFEIILVDQYSKDKSIHVNDKIIAVAQGKDGEFEDIIGWRLDAAVAKSKVQKEPLFA